MSCFPTMPRPFEGVEALPQLESQEFMSLPVIGNKRNAKYHMPHCSGSGQINLENPVGFTSEAEDTEPPPASTKQAA
jgi:hypothetical protein